MQSSGGKKRGKKTGPQTSRPLRTEKKRGWGRRRIEDRAGTLFSRTNEKGKKGDREISNVCHNLLSGENGKSRKKRGGGNPHRFENWERGNKKKERKLASPCNCSAGLEEKRKPGIIWGEGGKTEGNRRSTLCLNCKREKKRGVSSYARNTVTGTVCEKRPSEKKGGRGEEKTVTSFFYVSTPKTAEGKKKGGGRKKQAFPVLTAAQTPREKKDNA